MHRGLAGRNARMPGTGAAGRCVSQGCAGRRCARKPARAALSLRQIFVALQADGHADLCLADPRLANLPLADLAFGGFDSGQFRLGLGQRGGFPALIFIEGLTMRRTRPRQRTRIFSPSVISEGISNVSSISAPSLNATSVNRKTPRELRSWVKPSPSRRSQLHAGRLGRLNANRCPTRRSTPTGGVVMVVSLPLRIAGERASATVAQSGQSEKFKSSCRLEDSELIGGKLQFVKNTTLGRFVRSDRTL